MQNESHSTTTENCIKQAVKLLREGKLVAIPTETVYGLAADASNATAIKKIFTAKGRPAAHPLIVHIANDKQLSKWAIDIPEIAYKLTKQFWPGPLTLILKKAPHVLSVITGGQNTVAIRSPNHPLTQKLLTAFDGGLVAPSANRFGHISPTTAKHVEDDLGPAVDLILDGGPCEIGIESTILDLTSHTPTILRPGMISAEAITKVIGQPVALFGSTTRAPGTLPQHYSPKTCALLIKKDHIDKTIEEQKNKTIIVLARSNKPINLPPNIKWFTLSNEPKKYAQLMYQKMREADQLNYDLIIIEDVPNDTEWTAIKDRLNRATFKI